MVTNRTPKALLITGSALVGTSVDGCGCRMGDAITQWMERASSAAGSVLMMREWFVANLFPTSIASPNACKRTSGVEPNAAAFPVTGSAVRS